MIALKKGTPVRVVSSRPDLRGKVATVLARQDIAADVKVGTFTGGPGWAYEIQVQGGPRIWVNDGQVEACAS